MNLLASNSIPEQLQRANDLMVVKNWLLFVAAVALVCLAVLRFVEWRKGKRR